MNRSTYSRGSNNSSQMLEELANRSATKILRVEGSFNDQQMRLIWNALGLYVSRNLRMGRGVSVPKLGIFTFTPPEINLKGVTNENQRDKKPRVPVFLIHKEFVKGLPLKTAIFYHQEFGAGLRPYTSLGSTGEVPITKLNILQISSYANMPKESIQLGVNRIIKFIAQKILAGENFNLEIPHVGSFVSRNGLVAVKFNEYLRRDTRTILSKSVDQRAKKGSMQLTTANLKKFCHFSQMKDKLQNSSQDFLQIDDNAKRFLRSDFGFHFNDQKECMKNSLTSFDRSYASREFDSKNNTLKNSHLNRITQSGFFTSKTRNFSREYNIALRLVKEWVLNSCLDSENSFKDFVELAEKKNELLNENDVWVACQKISSDITEQQAQELFRLLDANRDGFITKDDWKKNITFDTNHLVRSVILDIKKKNYKITEALQKMGLEGKSKVDIHTLQKGLKRLNDQLTNQQAFFLSRYISKGKADVSVEEVLQVLNLSELPSLSIDYQWESKFLSRLKKKMYDKSIFQEELENKFRLHDKENNGFIEQSDLKNVLSELGVILTISELIKLVKVFPINSQNHIHYLSIIEKLYGAEIVSKQPIKFEEFVRVLKEKFFTSIPVSLPISVRNLTSYLQSTLFKDEEEGHLLNLVRKIDVNKNNEVSVQDIKSFKEQIRSQNRQTLKVNKILMEELLIKLRQKSIKKKISFYDLFKKLDQNKDGFITREEWMKNIGQIIHLEEGEKQNLFEFLDSSQIQMIDYKTFLAFLNGTNSSITESEKFDWVEQCIQKVKLWLKESGLSLKNSFRLVDRDGDSYLNEKDLTTFLMEKIKYQLRELSHVRLQKLIKVLDTYKKGKIDQDDWVRLHQNEKVDWVEDARQQIGIVLSKKYSSLSDAFYDITQGDQKLIFASFKKWIEKTKALSGFIENEDILKKIFSDLDKHKKGYLLQSDFNSCFGFFNLISVQTEEVLNKLKSKFNDSEEAFKCMNAYKKGKLSMDRFIKFIEELFGDRFKKIDAKNIWSNFFGDSQEISGEEFSKKYGSEWKKNQNSIDKEFPRDDWVYEDFSIIKGTQIRTDEFGYSETEKMEKQVRKIVKNIRQILAASPKSLEQAFISVDTERTGRINNLQFKKAFRTLNIALTSKELDLLLNYCDFKVETLINWREFMKRFERTEDEQKINNRISKRLQHLSDLLHYYMVSPKDAFRNWNNPRTSYMSFEEFHKMVRNLYEQASESLPEFSNIRELFDHIDIRRDKYLDFQEFTQTFRNCDPPSLLMGTVPAQQNLKAKVKEEEEKEKPVREKEVPLFKNSPVYEDFVRFIGRNRKYIQDKVEKEYGKEQRLVPYQGVRDIISNVAQSNKLSFTDTVIRNSVAFSMTGQKVDYRLLLDNFKKRGEQIVEFPLKKMF